MTIRISRLRWVLPAVAILIAGVVSAEVAQEKLGAAAAPPTIVPRSLSVPEGALVAPGAAPELELLYTGDVIGYIEDCGCHLNPAGGLARRAWLLNQLTTNYPETPFILLDSGNFSDNPTESGDIRTAALLTSMKKLGYKAINVGERDLDSGYDDFEKRTQGLGIAFVSTNIVKQGTSDPVFPPYTVIDTKGTSGQPIRIGVLGISRYNPVWQKAGPGGSNLGLLAGGEMIKKYLPEVRAKSDIVVLLASIPKDDAHDLAKRFPDLDLILGAYGGIFNAVEENEGRVRIYYTGNQGKRVGESRITLDAKRRVSDVISYVHFLTARYPEDPAMHADVAAVVAKLPNSSDRQKPDLPKKLALSPQATAAGH